MYDSVDLLNTIPVAIIQLHIVVIRPSLVRLHWLEAQERRWRGNEGVKRIGAFLPYIYIWKLYYFEYIHALSVFNPSISSILRKYIYYVIYTRNYRAYCLNTLGEAHFSTQKPTITHRVTKGVFLGRSVLEGREYFLFYFFKKIIVPFFPFFSISSYFSSDQR